MILGGQLYPGIDFVSPDGRWRGRLEDAGEIPWGPPYFTLWISNAEPGDQGVWWGPGRRHLFGEHVGFSPDSRYLVAERWHDLQLPDVEYVAFDLVAGRTHSVCRSGRLLPAKIQIVAGRMLSPSRRSRSSPARVPRRAWSRRLARPSASMTGPSTHREPCLSSRCVATGARPADPGSARIGLEGQAH
jgi:hypothetical protein